MPGFLQLRLLYVWIWMRNECLLCDNAIYDDIYANRDDNRCWRAGCHNNTDSNDSSHAFCANCLANHI